ncbi:MAG: sugar phosphate isomerase/epimerase [Clostridiales bacterium]|nr:sugar phosphate isomerase/epimerase [Clostridiales bacterium]
MKGANYMLGVSLARAVFEGNTTSKRENDLIAEHENVEEYLENIREYGVESIEFRALAHGAKEEDYVKILDLIWRMGFNLTVHIQGSENYMGSSFIDIYPSAKYIIENFTKYQDELIFVVHALRDESATKAELYDRTVNTLRQWSDAIDRDGLPMKVALENNRKKGILDPGDSTEGVLNMINDIDRPNIGIIWDMGHFYSNILVERGLNNPPKEHIEILPSDSFLKNVIHTHIHGLDGVVTHNPLKGYESLPLELYVNALKDNGYSGIYNLELGPERFSEEITPSEGIYSSISRLAKSLEM